MMSNMYCRKSFLSPYGTSSGVPKSVCPTGRLARCRSVDSERVSGWILTSPQMLSAFSLVSGVAIFPILDCCLFFPRLCCVYLALYSVNSVNSSDQHPSCGPVSFNLASFHSVSPNFDSGWLSFVHWSCLDGVSLTY